MPWNEPEANGEGPPDLGELVSDLKDKIRNKFKSKDINDTEDNADKLSIDSCTCEEEDKRYFVDVILYCNSCSNILTKKTIKHPYKVAAILAVISYGASQFIEYVITDNRYPLTTEYAIIESCASLYEEPVSRRVHASRKDICLCAMEDTANEISYSRYIVNKSAFLSAFEDNAQNCIEQQE